VTELEFQALIWRNAANLINQGRVFTKQQAILQAEYDLKDTWLELVYQKSNPNI